MIMPGTLERAARPEGAGRELGACFGLAKRENRNNLRLSNQRCIVPTFGFSAFLKMLSLNPRPQRTEMRNRLLPSSGSGYDFHRQFRALAHRYLSEGEDLGSLIAETELYGNAAEGRQAREALEFLEEWRVGQPGRLYAFEPRTWSSPSDVFKVKYTADFGIEIDGVRVAVHIWKTQKPPLDPRMTYAALSLISEQYSGARDEPEDFAVLSVLDGRLYRLSDAPDQSVLANRVATFIEGLIADIMEEIAHRNPSRPADEQPNQRG